MTSPAVDMAPWAIGVDVGGTKIAAAVVDAQGHIAAKIKTPTDTSRPEAVLDSIASAARQALDAARVSTSEARGVGLGIPGILDPQHSVSRLAVNLGWRDMPVKERLEAALGLECAIENDVSVAAIGEGRFGLGRGRASMTYLSLGTGIAARSIIRGKLWRGATGLAGEIGHLVIEPDGPLCACGARGCLEAIAAGPAIARRAMAALEAGLNSSLADRSRAASGLTAERVFAAATGGDALAREILDAAGDAIAYGIAVLALSVNPEVITLGGGLASGGGPLGDAIHAGVARWRERSPVFREALDGDSVQVSALGHDAAVLGAASLVLTPEAPPAIEARHE